MKGLSVDVYRTDYDCTKGDITSKYNDFILTGEGVPEIFSTDDNIPGLKLVKRIIGDREYLHAEPIEPAGDYYYTFGGNFIYSSDSRFPNQYPIAVHDRKEQ